MGGSGTVATLHQPSSQVFSAVDRNERVENAHTDENQEEGGHEEREVEFQLQLHEVVVGRLAQAAHFRN